MTSDHRSWRDRRVLVTGCSGLLGSWLVRELVERRASVVGLIRDWTPASELIRSGLVDRIQVLRGSVQSQELMERALGEFEVETVFHLAAQTIVQIANANPVSTFDTNIRGTWSVLEACRRSPLVKQVVVASSDKAYGSQERLPYSEEMPLQGRHPYDVSKSCADLIARTYSATYKMSVGVVRCGNLYGGGDLNWNRIVPGTVMAGLRGEAPVIRSDGSMVRDFLYVEDAVLAYLQVAEGLAEQPALSGEAFNFSYESPSTVLELVQEILDALGRTDLKPDVRANARHEIDRQHLDSSKARRLLQWRPRFTRRQGLDKTIEWYRTFLGSLATATPHVRAL